jgi:hypothetical protein
VWSAVRSAVRSVIYLTVDSAIQNWVRHD